MLNESTRYWSIDLKMNVSGHCCHSSVSVYYKLFQNKNISAAFFKTQVGLQLRIFSNQPKQFFFCSWVMKAREVTQDGKMVLIVGTVALLLLLLVVVVVDVVVVVVVDVGGDLTLIEDHDKYCFWRYFFLSMNKFYCFLFPKTSVEKKIRSSFLALTMRIEFFDKIVILPKKKFFKKILVFGDFFSVGAETWFRKRKKRETKNLASWEPNWCEYNVEEVNDFFLFRFSLSHFLTHSLSLSRSLPSGCDAVQPL